ncbi:MAG: right-handed parallel beta-helix repeat-containing protein [Candidatus Brocadiia bacterium]
MSIWHTGLRLVRGRAVASRRPRARWRLLVALGALALAVALDARAGDAASTPGEVQPEPSTLHCLAVRWPVKGDDNANASISVQYRKAGRANWEQGFPLFRTIRAATRRHRGQWSFRGIPPDRLPGGWIFAGSIVDLEPETEYEVKLSLKDPDGGDAERTLEMATIGEPKEPQGMRLRHVVPEGTTGGPAGAIQGLRAAAAAMEPGDLFLLHKGRYAIKGVLELKTSGEPGRPIIFRGAGDGEAIIDGGGDHSTRGRLISANAARHIWLENLTIQGRQYAIVAHKGSNWVIRRCKFQKMEKGFTAHNGGYNVSRGHFISDNVFIGPTTWPRTKGIESFCATYMSGAGHVVCYNRMQNLGDGVHGTGHGNWSACDIHNNDVTICTDDGFEADYGETNIRVFHNRIVNVAHGITAQPAQGGPIYFFRNFIYNATFSPFKLHNDTCGVLIFHNTCLRNGPCFIIQPGRETVTDVWTRNNLFLGTRGTGLHTTGRMTNCDFDNDGFGGFTGPFASWNRRTYKTPAAAKAAEAIYKEHGAILVDPKACFASGLVPPADPGTTYKGDELDYRLRPDGPAVDEGVVLPNFSDGFRGQAPDLGALEVGEPMPHFGPRE